MPVDRSMSAIFPANQRLVRVKGRGRGRGRGRAKGGLGLGVMRLFPAHHNSSLAPISGRICSSDRVRVRIRGSVQAG